MDNVSIVVESLDEAISFFTEIGLTLEGRATVEGEWAGRVTGLIALTTSARGGQLTPIRPSPTFPFENVSLFIDLRCCPIRALRKQKNGFLHC